MVGPELDLVAFGHNVADFDLDEPLGMIRALSSVRGHSVRTAAGAPARCARPDERQRSDQGGFPSHFTRTVMALVATPSHTIR
jgi:hypothetical protein